MNPNIFDSTSFVEDTTKTSTPKVYKGIISVKGLGWLNEEHPETSCYDGGKDSRLCSNNDETNFVTYDKVTNSNPNPTAGEYGFWNHWVKRNYGAQDAWEL